MAGNVADVVPKPRSGQVRSRPPLVLPSVMAAGGAAFAVLNGLDGSPAWRTARVLAVDAGHTQGLATAPGPGKPM